MGVISSISYNLSCGTHKHLAKCSACLNIQSGSNFSSSWRSSELTALAVADWAEENGVELAFISPGKPMQNGFIERFNRSYRESVLDMYIFETLEDVKTETEKWLDVYNQHRPHDSLSNLMPMEYLQKFNPETVI